MPGRMHGLDLIHLVSGQQSGSDVSNTDLACKAGGGPRLSPVSSTGVLPVSAARTAAVAWASPRCRSAKPSTPAGTSFPRRSR